LKGHKLDIKNLLINGTSIVVSPDPLCPALSTSSAMKTPENTEEDLGDPEQAVEGDIKMEYSSD
jgi:hypothetical protein